MPRQHSESRFSGEVMADFEYLRRSGMAQIAGPEHAQRVSVRHYHRQAMPIYEFECGRCGNRFEELMSSGAPPPACPSCGSARAARRLSTVSPPGRLPRGAKVRASETRRREREAARGERIEKAKKSRKSP